MTTERIVITFNENGSFRGASAAGFNGLPKPLEPADLDGFASSINFATFSEVERLTQENQQVTEQLRQAVATIEALERATFTL